MATHAVIVLTTWISRTMNVATNKNGIVTMSPDAVTIGVETASRSYPRRYATTDSPIVSAMANADPRTPPMTEIVTKSRNEIDRYPKASAARRASAARYSDEENVVMIPTYTFWYSTPVRSRVTSNSPACVAVPRRAPMAPKIVPFMPTAAGIRMNSDGSRTRVWEIDPSATPATMPAPVLRRRAPRPCRRVRRSALRYATRRRARRRGARARTGARTLRVRRSSMAITARSSVSSRRMTWGGTRGSILRGRLRGNRLRGDDRVHRLGHPDPPAVAPGRPEVQPEGDRARVPQGERRGVRAGGGAGGGRSGRGARGLHALRGAGDRRRDRRGRAPRPAHPPTESD